MIDQSSKPSKAPDLPQPGNSLQQPKAPKQSALLRVLRATVTLPAQVTLYASALGAIALVYGADLPPALAPIASGVGYNVLSNILDRVARGEVVSNDEIRRQVQAAIAESNISQFLTANEFQRTIAKLIRRLDFLKYAVQSGEYTIAGRLAEQYDRYESLVAELRSDISTIRAELQKLAERQQVELPGPPIPFMVEDLPDDFVPRPEEFDQLLANLLDEQRGEPVAITAALRGAGGYGKTTLAKALCHHERIRQAFKDGILWVTLGEKPDLLAGLAKLYAALTGKRPGFVDVEDAASALAAQWGDRDCLLVIDDLWNEAHLRPFLRGGEHCARLITTRDSSTLPPNTQNVNVDAMQRDEAVCLLGAGLPPGEEQALRDLAARLGEWPLLLKLANSALRDRVQDTGQSLSAALAYVNKALDKRGLTAFDARDPVERDQAVAKTLGLSFGLLSEDERLRYGELAIFPEDVDIPLAALEKLWGATGGLDEFDTEELCGRLYQLSLLLRFDPTERYIRLHDVVRRYLEREGGEKLPAIHSQLLNAYALERWADLPAEEPYLWRHLAYHLVQAGRKEELRRLLFDFDWLQAKLDATDATALIGDFDFLADDADLCLVQGAIRLAAHVLAQDKTQLAGQLLGRLLSREASEIQAMLEGARQWQAAPWPRPLMPSLTPPGGSLLRTLTGHSDYVNAVALTPDGGRAVSASFDLKMWDLESGAELQTLRGHSHWVTAVALTPDGRRAVSASDDQTLKVWDLESGAELRTLTGHSDRVRAVAITPDGQRAVSASADTTLKVWDLESGTEVLTLKGHSSSVEAVALTPDGRRAVSASEDRTLKVWDLESGAELRTLMGHSSYVTAVAITPDGGRAVSASADYTLKVWELESGAELQTLTGHSDWVMTVAITPDGRRAVSGSSDYTLKVWDLESGAELHTLTGHSYDISAVALTPDGRRAVSASYDCTLKVWDLESGAELLTLTGHSSDVSAVAITSDGGWVVSASWDHTLKVWDLKSGAQLLTLTGHSDRVMAVAITPDGRRAVSAAGSQFYSYDNTLKVWDLESGAELRTLTGHSDAVNAVALTPDGRRAVSASDDYTLKVWDLESGKVVASFSGDSPLWACAVAPDGVTIVAGERSGRVHFLRLEGGERSTDSERI